MANLTIVIEDELLQRARETAVQQRTSVNALVREYLQSYVDQRARRIAAADAFIAFAKSTKLSSKGSRWTRDELHDRSDL
jgi:predicted transcriptional regulator